MTGRLSAVLLMAVAGLLLRAAPSACQPSHGPRRVVILHSYASHLPAIRRFDEGLQQALRASSPDIIDFQSEYLDLGRRFGEAERSMQARHLREQYDGTNVDLVVTVGDGALTFLRSEGLFSEVPVVAYTERRPSPDARTTEPNVLRVWSGTGTAATVATALRLHPRTRELFVVSGRPENDNEFDLEVRAQLEMFDRLRITYLTGLPLSERLLRVRALPPGSLLFHTRLVAGGQPNRWPLETAAEIARASPVPVYTLADLMVGGGAVGGHVTDLVSAGTRLGEIAARVARGTPIASLPSQELTPRPVFDGRELTRWGIDRRALPAGSVVRFDQPGFWEQYWGYFLSALALCLVQTGVIGALLAQRARRRATEATNVAILRAVPDLMFLLDKDGVYLDYNAPSREALLLPPELFLGRNMRDVLPPQMLQQVVPLFQQVWDTDQPVTGEYTVEMGGSERHYEARMVRCNGDKVLGVMRDVTERARTEAALLASEQRYALATAAGRSGVWDWDLKTNEVYVDPPLKAILGFGHHPSRDRFENWFSAVHPDDRSLVMDRLKNHLEGRSPHFEAEHRIMRPDGHSRWFVARGSAVRHDGVAVRLMGTETDISARKHSEQALREAQTELARVSRFTALGEFAASIAHEVNQPLTAIVANSRACLRWLEGPVPDLAEICAALRDVVDAGARAGEVIRHNRDLFRHHAAHKAMIDINVVIGDALIVAAERLRCSEVTLVPNLGSGLPAVFGDHIELEQVLLNLIVNGVDAMESLEGCRRLEITSFLGDDGTVQVSVRDYGVGLAGVDLERMFTPAYTTKPNGTGVGLSISRLIIEVHGGRLWAEPNDGRGATFAFSVPAHSAAAAA